MTISLRQMCASDIAALERLTVQRQQEAFVEPLKETLANSKRRKNYVIEADGVLVGFFQIDALSGTQCIADHLELHEVSIDQNQQGKGYGRAFVASLPSLLRQEFPEAKGICLTVNCKNKKAKKLYELGGFRETGALKLEGRSGPQFIMRLNLQDETL